MTFMTLKDFGHFLVASGNMGPQSSSLMALIVPKKVRPTHMEALRPLPLQPDSHLGWASASPVCHAYFTSVPFHVRGAPLEYLLYHLPWCLMG